MIVRVSAAVAGALLLCACARPPVQSGVTERLVIVGVDGATWNIMSPLMSRGQLPRLASLVQTGSAGRLRAAGALVTAPLWTSVVTGCPPAVHGILSDVVRIPGRYGLRPVTADMRRVPALWTIAADRGVTVGVVGWPATFPAEAVRGYMVSEEWDPSAGASPRGAYPDGAVGDRSQGDEDRLVIPERLLPVAALDEDLRRWFERDLEDLSRGIALWRVHQPAIAFFRFRSIDGASHRFWHYMERRFLEVMAERGEPVAPEAASARARAIPGAYEMFDAWIGMLMDRIPEDSTLLIVSNHGFRGIHPDEDLRVDLDLLLRKLGYQAQAAGGEPDWARTKAFALEGESTGPRGVYLNMKAREVEGSLDSASAEGLARQLAGDFEAIASTDGRKLFTVASGSSREGSGAPELLVTQETGLPADAAFVIGSEAIPLRDMARPTGVFGVHDAAGIVLGAGRGIARGEAGWEADLLDVAPTVLYLAGLDSSAELPGVVMKPLLAEPASTARPAVSYDRLEAAPPAVLMPAPNASTAIDAMRRTSHLLF